MTKKQPDNILEVRDLHVEFTTYGGTVKAVRGVNFDVERGKTLGIVGESGCGKSVSVQAVMGLIPSPPGRVTQGSAKLNGEEILNVSASKANQFRGADITMIFQDPMTSLNPTMRIGDQIAEVLTVHKNMSKKHALARAVELLDLTKIPEPNKRIEQYPFEFSGGMLQRVMIAMSLACNPAILIADEPTTALDVTIQAQILELMSDLQRQEGMSIILITHDLGVISRMADKVAVMYAGQIIESGFVEDIFYKPSHPYTLGLKAAMPSQHQKKNQKLSPIAGSPPDLFDPPKGCGFFPRCPLAMKLCQTQEVPIIDVEPGHYARCWLQHCLAPDLEGPLFQPNCQKNVQIN